MDAIASQITSLTIVYSTVYSDADQSKHQSSASLAFVREIHRGPVNFPHKWPVTRKMFPFDDVIMPPVTTVDSPRQGSVIYKVLHAMTFSVRIILRWKQLNLNEIFTKYYMLCVVFDEPALGKKTPWSKKGTNMMTSSNGNIFRVTGHLCGEFTARRIFSLICVWINGWVNNRETGGLRRYPTHYDVIVLQLSKPMTTQFSNVTRQIRSSYITVGERTVALKIIARWSITQTPTGQWNIDNFAV